MSAHLEPKGGTQEHTDRMGREEMLDRTIEGSFPASDPPSTLPNPRLVRAADAELRSETMDPQKERAS